MAEQLVLLDESATYWRLDERTRRRGRQGVADARRVLEEARLRFLARTSEARPAA